MLPVLKIMARAQIQIVYIFFPTDADKAVEFLEKEKEKVRTRTLTGIGERGGRDGGEGGMEGWGGVG